MKVVIWLLDRFVPTLLMGASAALLAVGVLSYAPSAFGQWMTPEPTTGGDPLFETTGPGGGVAWASGGPGGSGDLPSASPTPFLTLAPGATPSPEPSQQPLDLPTDPPISPTSPASPASPTDEPPPTYLPTDPPGRPTQPPHTPRPGHTAKPTPTAIPIGPTPTPGPGGTPRPTNPPTPTPPQSGNAVATRVVIPSLDIDLPLVASDLQVRGNDGNYPLCDVAMYMVGFVNPGQAGTTYIYGHAQEGMFAPLLHASKYNDGASMIGALVQVYTSDNLLHLYEIRLVKRHATDLSITRIPAGVHQLVLQTSEGWHGHIPKLQIAARPLTVLSASYADAHPTPHPRVCLP
ncbi:MAG TPA: hypothetical protein VM284_02820 [Candidatus Limnocylindria bacterium]|nr:hypothetical protein [Candidatus Limnocylindria bacterium]